MFSKFTLVLSIFIILFVHVAIFANQKTDTKVATVSKQTSASKMNIKKVVLKEKKTKTTPKKNIDSKPLKKEIKKIVKKAKKKVVKKKIEKKQKSKKSETHLKKLEKINEKKTQENIKQTSKTTPKKIVSKKTIISTAMKEFLKNEYLAKVRAKIEKNKIYPKRAKRLNQQGVVVISLEILKNGYIKSINLKNSSKFKRLNKATLKLFKKIIKFEPIPSELNKNRWLIEVPVNYSIT